MKTEFVKRQDFPFAISKGMKLTIIVISDFMAHTMRSEIEITGISEADRPTFKERGKRKQYYLKLAYDAIVLEGWDLPIKADSDGNQFCGNACFNLVAKSPDELKELLSKSLNPLSDQTKAKVFYNSMESFRNHTLTGDTGTLLYPEIETHHAVVNGWKERNLPMEEETNTSATADFNSNGDLSLIANAE